MKAHFQTFSRYNTWANRRLYEATATLSDEAKRLPRPAAYFGSLLGTLNHLLLVDQLWFDRVEGRPGRHTQLDGILYEDFAELRAAREQEDAAIEARVATMTDEALAADLTYHTITGGQMRNPLHQVLSHIFNHQTHHRGQAHALLKDAGLMPPPLDLLYYLRDQG
ncbi:putative damage-inducible protein DinB [Limibacillus halophilus]|uniref:Putative damage-inducible protein DinB n=2 Tax=Limibacillus halophilus TaxID=1579333 RepID=A0A839SU50_9PROT|nr:putative damage-inducible protein DinB [Limibacillus halophilus]